MDSYPSLPVDPGSTIEMLDGIKTARAENGEPQVWSTWPAPRVGKMVLKHKAISTAERDALDAFYLAHRGVPILHNSRLTRYQDVTCRMVAPPQFQPSVVAGCWDAVSNFIGG